MADFRIERLAAVAELAGRYRVLDPKTAREVDAAMWRHGLRTPEQFVNLSALTTDAGTALLAAIAIPPASSVWVSYWEGGWVDTAGDPMPPLVILTDWAAFAQCWDDFWYPSSDDVRVATIEDPSRTIEINHEEELREIKQPTPA